MKISVRFLFIIYFDNRILSFNYLTHSLPSLKFEEIGDISIAIYVLSGILLTKVLLYLGIVYTIIYIHKRIA